MNVYFPAIFYMKLYVRLCLQDIYVCLSAEVGFRLWDLFSTSSVLTPVPVVESGPSEVFTPHRAVCT